MKPPARAIVGNLVWSADGGVWARVEVSPFPHAHTAARRQAGRALPPPRPADQPAPGGDAAVGLRAARPGRRRDRHGRRASTSTTQDAWVRRLRRHRRLAGRGGAATSRRYYVAAALPSARRPWLELLRGAARRRQRRVRHRPQPRHGRRARAHAAARPARSRSASASNVSVAPGRRRGDLLALRPGAAARGRRAGARRGVGAAGQAAQRVESGRATPRGVLAHLTDAIVKEGGYRRRPRPAPPPALRAHRRARRARATRRSWRWPTCPTTSATPAAAASGCTTPTTSGSRSTGACGCKAVGNADAQAKVRRKHRDLVGQVDEYDGEVTGAPPQLAAAIQAIDEERAQLGANPTEPELQVTILLSIAAPPLAELEDQAAGLVPCSSPRSTAWPARPAGRRRCCARCCPAPRRRRCAATTRSSCWPATWRPAARSAAPRSATRPACCSACRSTAAPARRCCSTRRSARGPTPARRWPPSAGWARASRSSSSACAGTRWPAAARS